MLSILNIGRQRWITHIVLAVLAIVGYVLTTLLQPLAPFNVLLTDSTGYVSLIFMVFILLIGPWQMYQDKRRRRNPVNINLRRDVGIWAGITGLVHVVVGFGVHLGGDISKYLLPFEGVSIRDWLIFFGFSNWVGLAATLILIVLLLISNDISLNKLKGPLWKRIQQTNYVLVALVFLHTFGYQFELNRARVLTALVAAAVLLVLAGQFVGISVYRARQKQPARAG